MKGAVMTTLGPDNFVRCPHCRTPVRMRMMASGNGFGSVLWSNGYLDAPMLMEPIIASKCPSCHVGFFIEDAEDLGDFGALSWGDTEKVPLECQGAPYIEKADANSLSELLDHCGDPSRERYLLVSIWHAYNHRARVRNVPVVPRSPRDDEIEAAIDELYGLMDVPKPVLAPVPPEIPPPPKVDIPHTRASVLERLAKILPDDGGQDRVLKAEALRELGRHDEAIALLTVADPSIEWVATQILAKARESDTTVFALNQ